MSEHEIGGREVADIYLKLREQALGFGSKEIKAPPVVSGGRVLGVLMDLGYDVAIASILGLSDGTTSMYLSNGGGTIGMGDQAPVAAATRRWVEVAEAAPGLVEVIADSLPPEGVVRFNVLTTGALLEAAATEVELQTGTHPLSALYVAGQDVVNEIRVVQEASRPADAEA